MATRSGMRTYDPRKPQVNILSMQSIKSLEFRSVIFIGHTRPNRNLGNPGRPEYETPLPACPA